MKIVFFGSPSAALPSLRRVLSAGHSVELVITQPDRPAGRGRKLTPCAVKEYALEQGLPVLDPAKIRKDETILESLRRIKPDIHVVVAYGQIIPTAVIDFPPHHSLNVHFSLLPKYRGASPVAWAILNGERTTGVTIFRLNAKMDEGDIMSWAETEIKNGETGLDLENRLADLGADLLLKTLDGIDGIRPHPQDHSLATMAPKLRKEDGLIDWSLPALSIDRKVRAFHPWPSTFTFLDKKRLLVRKGLELPGRNDSVRPGEILNVSREGIDIACGGGTVFRILSLQFEGRKEMDVRSLSAQGTPLQSGRVLAST